MLDFAAPWDPKIAPPQPRRGLDFRRSLRSQGQGAGSTLGGSNGADPHELKDYRGVRGDWKASKGVACWPGARAPSLIAGPRRPIDPEGGSSIGGGIGGKEEDEDEEETKGRSIALRPHRAPFEPPRLDGTPSREEPEPPRPEGAPCRLGEN